MALVRAAATLACVKPKEGSKESTGGTTHPQKGATTTTPQQEIMFPQQQQQQGQFVPNYGTYPYGAWQYPTYDRKTGAVYPYQGYPPTPAGIYQFPYSPYGSASYGGLPLANAMPGNSVAPVAAARVAAPAPSTTKISKDTNAKEEQPVAASASASSKSKLPSDATVAAAADDDETRTFVPFRNAVEGEASRLAVEKLIDDDDDDENGVEWSQMSRVKRMMSNDDESEAANAIVSHLAKSPGRSSVHLGENSAWSQFPSAGFDASNISGLSVLNEASRQAYGAWKGDGNAKKTPSAVGGANGGRASILSQVLANTKSKDSERSKTSEPGTVVPLLPSASSTNNSRLSTPSKGSKSLGGSLFGSFQGHSLMSPTTMLRAGEGLNTNMSLPPYYSPTDTAGSNMVMGVFDDLKTTTTTSLGAGSTGTEFLRELSWQTQSQQQLDATSKDGTSTTTTSAAGGGGNSRSNSLMIAADDYEAVSALEALSNSPFRHPMTLALSQSQSPPQEDKTLAESTTSATAADTATGEKKEQGEKASGTRASLFSKVIGGTKRKNNSKSDNGTTKSSAAALADRDMMKSPKKKLKF
jgi:hypothetical protein